MKKRDDAIDVIVDIVRGLWPKGTTFTPDTATRVELEILAQLGGEQVYFPKTVDRRVGRPVEISDSVRQAAAQDARAGRTTAEIQRRHNIGRTTIYRLLKRDTKADR